ncbi:acyl-CoA thioesterase [Catalinimonas niigatensis]|uniref:acyl-CoA thioesterase n=1 Tax=Catalinimonas niigatensis TaxID=1397264 RepID=UPI002665457B|nr:acyl-CoA thioesterase [Catalinimonas niigatensis]WPP48761.1 acyl-CoA thioesterase [Catalinimonas niigatensis]
MLVNRKESEARFSEVDSMGIVWHGHYIRYFEDGREAFGKEHSLGYMHVYEQGFFIPIVNVNCNYKRPIRYNEPLMIETRYVDTPAAKIIFNYTLYNKHSKEIYATGSSEQVFLTRERELHLTVPDFFVQWKKDRGIVTS